MKDTVNDFDGRDPVLDAPWFRLAMDLGIAAMERGRARDDPSHDSRHLRRVTATALRLARAANASESQIRTTMAGAALHDFADAKLLDPNESKEEAVQRLVRVFAAPCLENGWLTSEECEKVVQIVLRTGYSVMRRESREPVPPVSFLELDLVRDADLLDSIGAIGIARCVAYGAAHGRPLRDTKERLAEWDARSENQTPDPFPAPNAAPIGGSVEHFYEKLLRVDRVLATEPARRVAVGRMAIMRAWLRQLDSEEDGLDVQ